jgi:hypothetical protein
MRYTQVAGSSSEWHVLCVFNCLAIGELNMLNRFCEKALVLGLVLIVAAPVWAQRGQGRGMNGSGNGDTCLAVINSTPKQALDSTEAAGLTYLREEEKLARDVYITLYSKWGVRVFGNISQSEDQHFGAIKLLLDRYQLPDPAANHVVGIFQNEGLQTLYGDLISQGESSLNSAMRVGAILEELDIRDLEKAAASTDNNDLKLVYQNLRQASENHMRAFVRQLAAEGESYLPQYITPAAFSEIVAGSKQTGMGFGARGKGQQGLGRGNNGICRWK